MRSLDELEQGLRQSLGVTQVPNTSLSTWGGRQQQAPQSAPQRQAVPQRPMPQLGGDLAQRMAARRAEREAEQAALLPPPQEDLPWHKKALGTVLGNGAVQVALKPLDWAQTGGRGVIAGMENLARVLPEDVEKIHGIATSLNPLGLAANLAGLQLSDIDEDRENIGSWWDRATDSEYGWGTAQKETGNKWLDRGRGLAGDIMYDPLTYVTAGSSSLAGRAGRTAAASRIALQGGGDDVVRRMSTRGASSLTKAERAQFGLEEAGIRFAGARIPMSEHVANAAGRATSKVRLGVTQTRPWQKIARHPKNFEQASRILATGVPEGGMSVSQAGALIGWRDTFRGASKTVEQVGSNQAKLIFKGMEEASRKQLTHAREAGGGDQLKGLFDELYGMAKDAKIKMPYRKGYMPHQWSDDAWNIINDSNSAVGDQLRKFFKIDMTEGSGVNLRREVDGGVFKIGNKTIDFGNGTIADINKALKEAFPSAKIDNFLEDDAAKLVSTYISKVSTDIGKAKAFKALLDSGADVAKTLDSVSTDILDEMATTTANEKLAKVLGKLVKEREAEFKAQSQVAVKDAGQIKKFVADYYATRLTELGGVGERIAQTVSRLGDDTKDLSTQRKQVTQLVAATKQQAQKQLKELEGEFYRLNDELDVARVELASATAPENIQRIIGANEARRAELTAEIDAMNTAIDEVDQIEEMLAEFDDMADAIKANQADPDFMQELAQGLMPWTDKAIPMSDRLIGYEEIRSHAANRADAIEAELNKLDAVLETQAADEAQKIDVAVKATEERFVNAKQGVAAAEATANDAARELARAQSRALDPTETLSGLQAQKLSREAAATLAEMNGNREAFEAAWKAARTEAGHAETIAAIARRNADDARVVANTADAAEEAAVGRQFSAIDQLSERVASDRAKDAEVAALGTRSLADKTARTAHALRGKPDYAPIEEAIQTLGKRAKEAHDDWVKAETTALKSWKRGADETAPVRAESARVRDMEQTILPAHDEAIRATRSKFSQQMGELRDMIPDDVSRAYIEAQEALAAARVEMQAAESAQRQIDAIARKAERLSTPERTKRAKEAVLDVVRSQAAAARARKPVFDQTATKPVQAELLPRDVLSQELAAVTGTPPITEVAKITKAVDRRVGKPIPVDDLAKGVLPDEVVESVPAQVGDAYRDALAKLTFDDGVGPIGNEAASDRLDILVDWMQRYHKAVQAGAEPSEALASRVTREVNNRIIKRTRTRLDRRVAAEAGGQAHLQKGVREDFTEAIFGEVGEMVEKRTNAKNVRNYRGLASDADQDAKIRRPMSEYDEAASDRFMQNTEIRQADDEARQAREALGYTIEQVTGIRMTPKELDAFATSLHRSIPRTPPELVGKKRATNAWRKEQLVKLAGERDSAVARLFDSIDAPHMAKLERQYRSTTRDVQRELRTQVNNRKGINEGRTNWFEVLSGADQRATQARRRALETQQGVHAQADKQIAGELSAAQVDSATARGMVDERMPTVERGINAEQELAQLPNPNAAVAAEVGPVRDAAKLLAGDQRRVADAADKIDAVLRQTDAAAADELDKIDQAIAVNKKMAADMTADHKNVVADVKAKATKVKEFKPAKGDLTKTMDDLQGVIDQLPSDPALRPVVAMMEAFVDNLVTARQARDDVRFTIDLKDAAEAGKLTRVTKQLMDDGWTKVGKDLFGEGNEIGVQESVARALQPVIEQLDTGEFWKTVDQLTRVFKTYATATPGFHFRNAMGAAFMNATEGVGFAQTGEAYRIWNEVRKDPVKGLRKLEKTDPEAHAALTATFGSGAGGSWSKAELSGSKSKIVDNPWTKASHFLGTNMTEGPLRLALALKTTRAGGSMEEALAQISRVHFDYSDLSKMDEKIKRLIPFWTFMSRNMPLQLQQMYMRPRLYSAYDHIADNLGGGVPLPEWLSGREAISGDLRDDGSVGVLSPDLQHLNLGEDVQSWSDPLRALSNFNPVMVSPIEATFNRNAFFDSEIGGRDERLMHVAKSLMPALAQGERLSGTGRYEDKQGEAMLRYLGIPYRNLSPQQVREAANG